MKNLAGKPQTLKQVNFSIIRRAIKEKGSVTRAEIVEATKISVTTVRTILTEMLDNNEIEEGGYDESIGGRRAVRYELKKNRFFGVVLCIDKGKIRYLIVNICGEIIEKSSFAIQNNFEDTVRDFLDRIFAKFDIKSIGIGVPGIVSGLEYQRKDAEGELKSYPIGVWIKERYQVPILLENDLNAITLGFGRCYLKTFPKERCENVNMAYIHFGKSCISAGFLSEGRLLRGFQNCVGELGLYPVDDMRTLDELLVSDINDEQYAHIIAKLIAGICCVLNPQYIAIGGEGFRKECFTYVNECFDVLLPERMSAEILYAEDKWHDYYEGMAYLTAEQIFAEVLLVKE